MIMTNKVGRFEIDDLLRKGYRAYDLNLTTDKDRYRVGSILYNRYFLDNFFIGRTVFVKNRKNEGS